MRTDTTMLKIFTLVCSVKSMRNDDWQPEGLIEGPKYVF